MCERTGTPYFALPPSGQVQTFEWDIEGESLEWTLKEDQWLINCMCEVLIRYGSLSPFRRSIVLRKEKGQATYFDKIKIRPWEEAHTCFCKLFYRTMKEFQLRFAALCADVNRHQEENHYFKCWFTYDIKQFCEKLGGSKLDCLYPATGREREENADPSWMYSEDVLIVGLMFTLMSFTAYFPTKEVEWQKLATMYNLSNIEHHARSKDEIIGRWKRLMRLYRLTHHGFAPLMVDFLEGGIDFDTDAQ